MPEACDTLRYEGYGPGGTAVLVDGVAAAEGLALQLRQLFRASGGYLGARGSVSYLFNHVGVLRFPATQAGSRLMNRALQAGAEDVVAQNDGSMEVLVDPPDFARIRRQLEDGGYGATSAQITWRPALRVSLQGQDAQQMAQLLLSLRKLTGVQNVYSNAEISEPILAGI